MSFLEHARRLVRSSTACSRVLRSFKANYKDLAVCHQTQLVMEGFPRCANSFAVVAFLRSQPKPVSVAHHLHSTAQIKLGIRQRLPILVLIRQPRDAILSLTIRTSRPRVEWGLDEYCWFYRSVTPVRDQVVVADFEEVTTDFASVIQRLNQRFDCDFAPFVHTPENVEAVYAELDAIERVRSDGGEIRATHVARPSQERAAMKRALAAQFDEPGPAAKLEVANQLYQSLAPSPRASASQAPARSPSTPPSQ